MILPRPKVTPVAYEPPFRWLVPSGSQPGEKHLVQLDAYGVNGRCSCPDFTCRHEPGLRADPSTGGVDKTRCKHIRLVRSHFLDGIIREMGKAVKAVALLACACLGAAPTDAMLDALSLTETGNRDIAGDGGAAAGRFQLHRAAWQDADLERQRLGLPRATYPAGAYEPAMARAYAATYLGQLERRLRRDGLEPTATRLWLAWSMGYTAAKRIGFDHTKSPAVKRRGLMRLLGHLGNCKPVK